MDHTHTAMSIAYDAKRIVRNATGLGNYSRYLIEAMAVYAPEVTLLLSASGEGRRELYQELLLHSSVRLLTPPSSSPLRRLPLYSDYWRNYGALSGLREQGATIYHGLSNELPLGISSSGLATVVTIHDLIYERFPQYYNPIDVVLYRYKYKRACEEATHIVAVSERTKEDLMELYEVPPEKISVLYQGCSPIFAPSVGREELLEVLTGWALPERYILSVGTIEERKNAGLIVQALPLLEDKDISLVLLGRSTSYTRRILEEAIRLGVRSRIYILSGVPTKDLPMIYRGAQAFVYPSKYEGFGIPIVEALTSRVPVVAAMGSCLEEAGGPYTLYCDPEDPSSLAASLDLALGSSDRREEMVREGVEWVKRFSPQRMVEGLLEVYQRVQSKL